MLGLLNDSTMSKSSQTHYGTVPTTVSPEPTLHYRGRSSSAAAFISARRPWREFLQLSSFSIPYSYYESMSRIRRNINHFLFNYTIILLLILFLSLIYHPISMIVFLVVFIAWFFLYLFRSGGDSSAVVVFNRTVDDRVLLVGLGLVTVVALVFSGVGLNVLVALVIGVVVVGFHGAFCGTEDLFLDEDEGVDGRLRAVVSV